MSFFFGVVGGPLQPSSEGGTSVAAPLLALADNGDGSGGVATISGSTTGATNRVYVQPLSWEISANWTLAGSRTGNGAVALSLATGHYYVYVESTLGSAKNVSLIKQVIVTAPATTVVPDADEIAGIGSPFRRLSVDHMVNGVTRVWWEYLDGFADEGPYVTQLQVSQAGHNNATDWVNVGLPATDTNYLNDETQRVYGRTLDLSYRVALTTATGVYVSQPVQCWGELSEKDWLLAREIVRKETVRQSGLAGRQGYLLKRRRTGAVCSCVDPLTGEVVNSDCPECYGTGIKTGYFAPQPCVCFAVEPRDQQEELEFDSRGQTAPSMSQARALAVPPINERDIWVDANSDERWSVEKVTHAAELRGVPLVVSLVLCQVPFSDIIYKIPVGGEAHEDEPIRLPGSGAGAISVDHDFGGHDELAYQTATGIPIVGASILAFPQAVFTAALPGRPDSLDAVASSETVANGRWAYAMQLDPGDYTLVFQKSGYFGPDDVPLTVE